MGIGGFNGKIEKTALANARFVNHDMNMCEPLTPLLVDLDDTDEHRT